MGVGKNGMLTAFYFLYTFSEKHTILSLLIRQEKKLVNINNMFTNNVLNDGLSFTHVA